MKARNSSTKVTIVDVFTSTVGKGNRAGVVTDAGNLSDAIKGKIAAQISVPETAFLQEMLPQKKFRIRWFSPTVEVPLCGHATIGSLTVLGMSGRIPRGEWIQLQSRTEHLSGKYDVVRGRPMSSFRLPVPKFLSAKREAASVLPIFGLLKSDLLESLPAVKAATHLYIFLKSRSDLPRPLDFQTLAEILNESGLDGVSLVRLPRLNESGFDFRSRFFAPGIGIDEDPVTGSANGPIAAYLARKKYARKQAAGQTIVLNGIQGIELNRRGKIRIDVSLSRGRITDVVISGTAVVGSARKISHT